MKASNSCAAAVFSSGCLMFLTMGHYSVVRRLNIALFSSTEQAITRNKRQQISKKNIYSWFSIKVAAAPIFKYMCIHECDGYAFSQNVYECILTGISLVLNIDKHLISIPKLNPKKEFITLYVTAINLDSTYWMWQRMRREYTWIGREICCLHSTMNSL